MLVISTREFRERQGMYLGMVANGKDVVLKSRKEGAFKIVPLSEDDALLSKEAFFAKIDRAAQSIKKGKGKTVQSREELIAYFDSL